ncbi:DUF484 family protein [Propionivibrio sp.]|uniref:DUF484 family protein n=1 Tax=Propionivibrio sp. TaxID=2212460 RepID=UPI0025CF0B0B|nr:DUF484 family protein [Propionivibrio sp.]MBK7355703.1 DUF484 family protein [Propionivibrio sp.]MBK8400633.1 DUF484 family protein [Propionivibrio sp.]MBK8744294.1 DUF484 family protein [Propionivibrio sp.]MBK8895103.1 DUF484 family protein [Propionivibrio sp.]
MKSEEIARYLQDNPQFFEEHADLVSRIVIPHPHGGRTISITERQMLSLRDKNKLLEGKMDELLQFGEENDSISEKMHRLAVAMIAASTFQAVLHILNFHLRDDFAIPHVALRLWNRPENIDELPEFANVSEELQVFAETLGQPYCGSTAGFETSSWFGDAASHLRSQALIAMRNGGGTIGMIALGSEEAQRFYVGMGTLYLERLGEMASAALARVLR